MPQILPTADELGRLTRSQRQRIRRAVASIALELDRVAAEQLRREERQRDIVAWGEAVREQARHLEATREREPDHITKQRQAALLEGMK